MRGLQQAIAQRVEALRDYLIATAQELVRTPSVNHPPTGDEHACQMIVASHLRAAGVTPEVYDLKAVPGLDTHPSYWPGRDYAQRPNVSARRRGAGGGRSLVLSGHIDTVPLGTQPWKHDPFGGQIEDGKLFGLGAYDMKSGVALILGVMRVLTELDLVLKGDLIAETVVDEEFGGVNGTLAGRVRGDNGDAMIITEPSDLAIWNGVRGGRVAHITLEGSEGILFGRSEPGQAMRQLGCLLNGTEAFRERRRAHLAGGATPSGLDPIPVWVTKVQAGGWGWNVPVTVPAEAHVELYWQLLPGEEQAQVENEFEAWLADLARDHPGEFPRRPRFEYPLRFMPASEIPIDAPIIGRLRHWAGVVIGEPVPVFPAPAPSDLFVAQRDFGLAAVHYGVRGGGAHAADEYLLVEDLVTATQALALLAVDWCGVASGGED